jgi:hypothetical protein
MVLGFGKKAKSAPLRVNNPKNKKNVTRKKEKYPLFKGYNPPGGPGRGTFHKKTEREKRLNNAWKILDPPGDGEGPGYKGKIRARVAELEDIESPTNIDRIELTYLKNLQTQNLNDDGRYYLDDESFKWNTYKGKAKNEWNAAAQTEWERTFPDVSDPLPPPPSTPPPTSNPTAAPTAATTATTAAPTAATTAATTAAPTAGPVTSILPPVTKNYLNRKAALSQGSTPTTPSDPTPPVLTQSTVSNAGDPTNINSTIKRMKCIVCNSQFIIYDGLGKKGEAPKCSKCNSSSINMNLIPGANNDKTAASNNKSAPSSNSSATAPRMPGANYLPNLERGEKQSMVGGRRSTRKQRKNKKRASRRR